MRIPTLLAMLAVALSGCTAEVPLEFPPDAYGTAIALGDLNCDGVGDVAIGSPAADRVDVYFGGANFEAHEVIYGDVRDREFGRAVAIIDVDGAECEDLIVSASNGNGRGRGHLFHGTPAGFVDNAWEGNGRDGFGESLDVGNVNGDAYGDLVAGSSTDGRGRADLWLGSATGFDNAPAWSAQADTQEGRAFGWDVAMGEMTGDGFDDVLISDPRYGQDNEGRVYAYFSDGTLPSAGANPDWVDTGQQDEQFGIAIAANGNYDGDTEDDLLVASVTRQGSGSSEGTVWLYRGSDGNGGSIAGIFEQWTGVGTTDRMGSAVSFVPDVTGEGNADIMIATAGYMGDMGRIDIYSDDVGDFTAPVQTAYGVEVGDAFGSTLAAALIDTTTVPAILVGAPTRQNDNGSVYLFQGATGTVPTLVWESSGR